MINNFDKDVSKQEYIFKLLPDFGVFDIAEKWFIENNKKGLDKLFFYENGSNLKIENVKFRRFIVKSNGKIEISANTNSNDIVEYNFEIQSDNYKVVIDEQFLSGGFTVSANGDYMIGVCF